MNLHIGGHERKDGWHVLNIQPGAHVDFLGDITDLSQFKDDTFEKVYASHVLEHVHQKQVLECIKGIRRVLKPGGQFMVSVPDWDVLCHLFINPLADIGIKWQAMRMMMGGQIDAHDFHYVGFNQIILYDFLRKSGFSSADRVESFGLFEDTSNARPWGFPISLNVIAKK